jgi:hypothetical protein
MSTTPTPSPVVDSMFSLPNIFASDSSRTKFCGLYEELLESLTILYPECAATQKALADYQADVKTNPVRQADFIQRWHRLIKPYYDMVTAGDNTFWAQPIPEFVNINLAAKVQDKGFSPENVAILWEYIKGMNQHAQLYNMVPEPLWQGFLSLMQSQVAKFMRGEISPMLNLQNMSPDQMQQYARSLFETLPQEQVSELNANMQHLVKSLNISSVDDIIRVTGPLLGDLLAGSGADNSALTGTLMSVINRMSAMNTSGDTSGMMEQVQQIMSQFGGTLNPDFQNQPPPAP